LLLAHGIKTLVDVRSFPSSRRFPQFNQKQLAEDLPQLGINYHHSPALWWKCHRCLIADYLKTSGVEVKHILATDKTEGHPYTSAARIVGGKLSYRGLLD